MVSGSVQSFKQAKRRKQAFRNSSKPRRQGDRNVAESGSTESPFDHRRRANDFGSGTVGFSPSDFSKTPSSLTLFKNSSDGPSWAEPSLARVFLTS